jgi:hypothetical protein
MAEIAAAPARPAPGIGLWGKVVLAAWLVPGAGHLLLKRHLRAAILGGSVLLMFVLGLMARGYLFEWQRGDVVTTLIYCGGYLANLAAGLPCLVAKVLGYNQPDIAGHSFDYGTKLMVAAGLCNILAIVDAYEIAVGNKD